MARYSTIRQRDDLQDYCLRRLGHPVIEINVSDDQIDDRIDDALQMYFEFHGDGQERRYIPVKITQQFIDDKSIKIDNVIADNPAGALSDNNDLGAVGDRIVSVVQVFPIDSQTEGVNFFDVKYQMRLNDTTDIGTGIGDLAYFEQLQQYLSLIDLKLTGHPQIDYNRRTNVLHIHGDLWSKGDLKVGDYIIVECYVRQNDSGSTDLYDDIFIKECATALIKRQWGENLSKFEGMQLPGGVTINAARIIEEANTELERIRERLLNDYDTPPGFFLG